MQEVDPRAGEPTQLDVAVHHQLLGERWPTRQTETAAAGTLVHHRAGRECADLAVLGERDVECSRVLQRSTHQLRVLHAVAVVGEQAHAGGGEFAEWHQGGAGAAHGDARRRVHVAETGSPPLGADELDHRYRVLRRFGVRHGHDRGESSEGRGSAAGLDRLGLLAAGLAKVHVQIDEAGGDDAAGCVEHVVVVASRDVPDLDHPSVGDGHIGASGAGLVDHGATADHPA
jgi:hypothetical protein